MTEPSAAEITVSPEPTWSAAALAGLVELIAGPVLTESSATVSEMKQEAQRATASAQSTSHRNKRFGSDRQRAIGRAHGGDDTGRRGSGKGDQ